MPRSSPAAIKRPVVTSPAPVVTSPAPVVTPSEPSLMSAVKSGFGWGIGTSVARSLFGGAPQPSVKSEPTEFERCIAEHRENIALCAHLAQKK
jgi:hypothetical protein